MPLYYYNESHPNYQQYMDGYLSRCSGTALRHNPELPDSTAYEAWEAGWFDAQEDELSCED